ncbi:adaptin ear-binding coat-associated protein 2-like [Phalaenopsis equestris]|uniref:adaptin ear-binding coat-associated protein 2-like n=1 Tax=Phalaenopsis equestris TaxID=78828 RepID=UPI0009E43DD8|nr:adaptin ear-binding coat-associated protein 2-like [Phalaenopsis equestris]
MHEDGEVGAGSMEEGMSSWILFLHKYSLLFIGYNCNPVVIYRADEWNVNKWHWEGALKVVSKGEDCIIRLEDRETGELFARAFVRTGEPNPVEPVIDSSRYFVLRVEENIGLFLILLLYCKLLFRKLGLASLSF